MTKADLVDKLATTLQLPKHQTVRVVDLFFRCIMDALRAQDQVALRGFGSFRLRPRRARTARNPRTGAPVHVPAKTVPWFTPGQELHGLLNPHLPARRGHEGGRRQAPAAAGRAARGSTA